MRRYSWVLGLAVLYSGCQTLTEQLPTTAEAVGDPVASPSPNPPATTQPSTPTPAPTPTPEPTPEPTPPPEEGPGKIAKVRVAFFGIACHNGKQAPNNGARLLPVGCTGFVTATPKKADGTDVPPEQHGDGIVWELLSGDGMVEVVPSVFESDFNRDVKGRRPGSFSLCATVRTVMGCLDGNVIP
jgi:hypothetical protein